MNTSDYIVQLSSQVSPFLRPSAIWARYVNYLWAYEPNSWVAKIAYSYRVLAILVVLPIVVLALLDITSYGIARTLGVIDDVNASTSDKETVHKDRKPPSIRIHESTSVSFDSAYASEPADGSLSPSDHVIPTNQNARDSIQNANLDHYLGAFQPHAFYASDDNNLKLSGVGVFSPAASQPPSPTLSRSMLHLGMTSIYPQGGSAVQDHEGLSVRRKTRVAAEDHE